jgi:hypothetical protein
VSRVVARPWHMRDHDPVLGAGHPGRVRLHERPEQPQVQRPPPAPARPSPRSSQRPVTGSVTGQARQTTPAVSGYWQTDQTLARWCRINSDLTSARNHGLTVLDAIHTAPAEHPWLPTATPA